MLFAPLSSNVLVEFIFCLAVVGAMSMSKQISCLDNMNLMRIHFGVLLYVIFLFLLKTELSLSFYAASFIGNLVLVTESTKLQSEKVLS